MGCFATSKRQQRISPKQVNWEIFILLDPRAPYISSYGTKFGRLTGLSANVRNHMQIVSAQNEHTFFGPWARCSVIVVTLHAAPSGLPVRTRTAQSRSHMTKMKQRKNREKECTLRWQPSRLIMNQRRRWAPKLLAQANGNATKAQINKHQTQLQQQR